MPWFMPSIGEYEKIIAESNFSEINIWEENADRYFGNQDEMIKWIEQPSIVPFIEFVAEEMKSEFLNDVIKLMVEKTKGDDGKCFETFRRINMSAIKK